MKLHIPSVLLTAGVAGLVLLTSSQALTPVGGYRIEYLPHPRDMVQIKEDVPFVVPAGKLFVLTALGGANVNASTAQLFVDGQEEVSARMGGGTGYDPRMVPLASGFTVPAGATITVIGFAHVGRAWGYLASQ